MFAYCYFFIFSVAYSTTYSLTSSNPLPGPSSLPYLPYNGASPSTGNVSPNYGAVNPALDIEDDDETGKI